MTQRICFRLQVGVDHLDSYRTRHADVWPEMQNALREAGWRNYSIFLDDEGSLVGYLECEDFTAAQAAMAATEVNARWQAEMAHLFEGIGGAPPDQAISPIPEIFHLD